MKSPNDLVGDLLNDLAIDGRSRACLQLGLKRAQQGLDRIEINRWRDRLKPRAKLAEQRVQLPHPNIRVSEAVELAADFGEYRLESLSIRVSAGGGSELGVEIAQEAFDGADVDRCGRKRLKRLAHAINTARQVVEAARIDRRGERWGEAIS